MKDFLSNIWRNIKIDDILIMSGMFIIGLGYGMESRIVLWTGAFMSGLAYGGVRQ